MSCSKIRHMTYGMNVRERSRMRRRRSKGETAYSRRMDPLKRHIAEKIAVEHINGLLPRRAALRRLALLGVGTASATALISACENRQPDESTATTSPSVKAAAHAAEAEEVVRCDASAGGFTVTLPQKPPDGTQVWVKKVDTSANAVIVQRSGSDTFNLLGGPTQVQLSLGGETLAVRYRAGVWVVTGHGIPKAALDGIYSPLFVRELLDAYGATALALTARAGAVNYLEVDHTAPDSVKLIAAGAEDNLNLFLGAKGSGAVCLFSESGVTPTIRTSGPDENQDLNLRTQGTGTVQANGVPVANLFGSQTLSNKRIWRRVVTSISTPSLTPSTSAGDIFAISQLAQGLAVNAPSGSTAPGEELLFRIRDNGTSQPISWDGIYRPIGVSIPTPTAAGKWVYIRCIYNEADARWDVIDVKHES